MKNILIVTEQYFPHGSAMAGRIFNFCKLFKEIGNNVFIIALHSTNENIIEKQICNHKGFDYQILCKRDRTSLETFVGSDILINGIKEYLKENKVDYIFAVGVHIRYGKLLSLCKENEIPLVIEQCERYDVSSYKFSYADIRYIRFNNNFEHNYPKADGIISISRYIDEYYKGKGTKSIRIPSIFDVKSFDYNLETNNKKIKLIYTGTTSKSKDIILPIIEALVSKKEYIDNFEFDLYGVNEKQLLSNIDNKKELLDKSNGIIKAHGYVSNEEFAQMTNSADYQVFIKPDRRSSKACFPTKFAESMAHAIPVITNLTGDIGLYLKDGINGFVCKSNEPKDICKALDSVLKVSKQQAIEMRKQARLTAEESFDYRKYTELITDFLNNL